MPPRALGPAALASVVASWLAACSATQIGFPDSGPGDGASGEGDVSALDDGSGEPADAPDDAAPAEDAAGPEADGDDGPGAECEDEFDCDDEVDCTLDTCELPAGVCRHEPQDGACDDGNVCTAGDFCDPARGCLPGPADECDDGIACTRDDCSPLTGACTNTPDHRLCASPELCLPDEGGCAAPPPCDDDGDCDDANACNGVETCEPEFGCQAGPPPDCRDEIDCTRDECNPFTGDCLHSPDDAFCDNGNRCDGDETCSATAGCQRGTPADCDDGVPCTADACNPLTAACTHEPDDARCDDGRLCNGAEVCVAGSGCAAGSAPDCGDGIACTVDRCDAAADACVSEPDDARCDDGRFCNGAETCARSAGCLPGTAPSCDDGLSCTRDACDPAADSGRGACVATAPDADGDGHGDAACTGDDCDDGAGAVHPGATEACNATDDDCDGDTDEAFACVRGATGGCTIGSCSGTRICRADCTWGACTVGTTELCNGFDDDCSGAPDEGFECVLGTTRGCAVGTCGGTQTCVAGCTWGTCTVTASEICNGADDDCDGTTDEGYTCIPGRTQPCTVGACGGTQTCSAACSWGTCVVGAVEACNGADDDCNGATDESFECRLGTTQGCANGCGATGTRSCQPGSCTWGACSACVAEACGNGCDDNCDGRVDEGCCTAGDTCECPFTIGADGGVYSGTTSGMGNDYGGGCGGDGAPDVVYRMTLTSTRYVIIDTSGSGFDTVVHVHQGSCGGYENGCDDDGGVSTGSRLEGTLGAGTYYVVVDGYDTYSGSYSLQVTFGAGDTCADPRLVPGPGTYYGDTCYLGEDEEGSCGWFYGQDDVLSLYLPSATTLTLSLAGSSYDTVLYVRSGSCGGSEVECDDDDGPGTTSYISVALAAGWYYVFVDGYDDLSCGEYHLSVSY